MKGARERPFLHLMDPKFQNIKAVFLDGGSAVLEEDTIYRERIRRTIKAFHLSLTEEEFFSLLIEGAIKRQRPYVYACEQLGLSPTAIDWDFSYEKVYPGAYEVLGTLHKKYKLALVANQPKGFDERVKKLNLTSYFDFVLGSEDYDVRKPDPAIYRLAAAKLGIKPSEAVMVGDRPENDIKPAHEAGCKAIWIKQGLAIYVTKLEPDEEPDATIASLKDLERILL
jgi:HAD superfamily hydrolase (TIGR01509 family)